MKPNIGPIKKYIQKNKLTNEEFCKKAGITSNKFEKILKKEARLSVAELIKIAQAIETPALDLIPKFRTKSSYSTHTTTNTIYTFR